MDSDVIKEIWIDSEGRVCVKPETKSFEYIYRSAMEIYWNSTEGFLYPLIYPRIIASWSPADWFHQILAAARNEYDCELLITPGTEWINIDQATREKIEEKYRQNASHTYKTLEYYNQSAQAYAADTLNADVSKLYAFFLSRLPAHAAIMDLGCGPGRDSLHFLREGYRVQSIDGSPEFCKLASQLTGQPVLCRTFEDIDFTEEFDGIWACASILHVPSTRLSLVLENLSRALKKGGHLYASFKYGTFEGDRNGRYFTDMTEETLEKLLAPFKEFTIIEMMITGDVREGREEEKWLNVLVRKGI